MTARSPVASFLLSLAITLVACGGDGPAPTAEDSANPTPTGASAPLPGITTPAVTSVSPAASALPAIEPPPAGIAAENNQGSQPVPGAAIPTGIAGQPLSDAEPPPSANAVILALALLSVEPAPGREFELSVQLESRGRGISGVQFGLNISPDRPRVRDIVPGDLLGPNLLQVRLIESEMGGLTYAAARRGTTPPNTQSGRLATIRMQVAEDVPPGTSVLVGLDRVLVADDSVHRVEEVFVAKALKLPVAAAP